MKTQLEGFTLTECLVSILLLAIVLAGSMAFFSFSNSSLYLAERRRIAAAIADSIMENVKNTDYANIETWAGTGNVMVGNLNGQKSVSALNVDEDSNGSIDYKRVSVVVSWNDPAKVAQQNVALDSLFYR